MRRSLSDPTDCTEKRDAAAVWSLSKRRIQYYIHPSEFSHNGDHDESDDDDDLLHDDDDDDELNEDGDLVGNSSGEDNAENDDEYQDENGDHLGRLEDNPSKA